MKLFTHIVPKKKGILKEQIIPPSPQKNDNGFYGL
jgi:hypothetical protein